MGSLGIDIDLELVFVLGLEEPVTVMELARPCRRCTCDGWLAIDWRLLPEMLLGRGWLRMDMIAACSWVYASL